MTLKIYTKTGDGGQTSLIGGTRVAKHHIRIEAYGTIDELNAHIGLLRDSYENKEVHERLIEIQDRLFTIGSLLAADPEKSKMKLPELLQDDVMMLEQEIDAMDQQLEPMKSFVLPGGHPVVSICHIARCVCRRAERCITQLNELNPVQPLIEIYINRLSDYLFMLSRKIAADFKAPETPWKPRI